MVQELLGQGYADERVAAAMGKLDRKNFVPEEHWEHAYSDHPLAIGFGQTISAPGVVAFMSRALDLGEGMRVLEVGAGSGWQAAILGELVGGSGEVWTVERLPELAARARENLERHGPGNVNVLLGDGSAGYPERAPYHRIMVTAAGPEIPGPLREQLAEGGKLIMPVGGSFFQHLMLCEKGNGGLKCERVMPVVFVPLIGEHGHRR
jgi:protein-L-isoaspartate(D-aspartate) O-methyltransferase